MESVPITKVESLNAIRGKVYSIQHYVIKFVSDLRQVSDFSPGTLLSCTNKADRHDITEILFIVALNTITCLFKWQILNVCGKGCSSKETG